LNVLEVSGVVTYTAQLSTVVYSRTNRDSVFMIPCGPWWCCDGRCHEVSGAVEPAPLHLCNQLSIILGIAGIPVAV
jgi:hypothetical protein